MSERGGLSAYIENQKRLERVASECDLYGHDYLVIDAENERPRRPERVGCARCDRVWRVVSWKVER